MATTHRNYIATDRAAVTAALRDRFAAADVRAELSAAWRGWVWGRSELDLGVKGTVNDPACLAIVHLVPAGPPDIVADQDAPAGRRYSLVFQFRTYTDPQPEEAFVDEFDKLLKNRLGPVWDDDLGKSIWSDVPWAEDLRTGTTVDTTHLLHLAMGD